MAACGVGLDVWHSLAARLFAGALGSLEQHLLDAQLGLHLETGQALQVLSVDPVPSDEVVDAVRALPGIESADLLDLGARIT